MRRVQLPQAAGATWKEGCNFGERRALTARPGRCVGRRPCSPRSPGNGSGREL